MARAGKLAPPLTLSGISRRARYSNGAESDSRGKKKEIKKKLRVWETYLMENGEIRRRDGKWKSLGRR